MNILLEPTNIKNIYETFKGHSKEKHDMILEPFQVMVQLALLSFSPIGTKISISNNILTLQLPTVSQGIIRWYNSDSKDDLYYLFHAVRRFYKWYRDRNTIIFKYILTLAKKGLERLIKTYTNSNKDSITHMLILYKALLDVNTSEMFDEDYCEIDKVFNTICELYDTKMLNIIYNILQNIEGEENEDFKQHYINGLQILLIPINIRIRVWIQENLAC
jgi:hypothetical protein